MNELALISAGLGVGAVIGMTGVGGGSLMTPLLIFGFGFKPYLAVGTDLLFAAFTKAGGTLAAARSGRVPWRVVAHLSAGSVPAALAMLALLHHLGPASAGVQRAMTATLGLALLLTAGATLYKALRLRQPAQRDVAQAQQASAAREATTPRYAWGPLALGALIGALVALTSVGAGAIGVSVLMLLYPRLGLPRIVAADIAYAVPMTLVAGLGHASLGSVDWTLLGWLLSGSLPGIWLGTRLMRHTPERLVRTLLSGLLAYAGLRLISL